MAALQQSIDLAKPGKYPVILSDALLGKGTKEIYTSIRYNHKPQAAPGAVISDARLSKAKPASSTKYNLSYTENDEEYVFQGSRQSGDGQYALIFDPARKAFVLHQIDSSFDMNLTKTPWDKSTANLRSSYEQLEGSPEPQPRGRAAQSSRKATKDERAKKADGLAEAKRRKTEIPKKAKARQPSPDSDSEDEDSDDGLTVEYPDARPPPSRFGARPQLVLDDNSDDESAAGEMDADFEDDEPMERDRDVEVLTLPSPMNNATGHENGIEDDLEMDLEAELEQELEKQTGAGGSAGDDESSESEEE